MLLDFFVLNLRIHGTYYLLVDISIRLKLRIFHGILDFGRRRAKSKRKSITLFDRYASLHILNVLTEK